MRPLSVSRFKGAALTVVLLVCSQMACAAVAQEKKRIAQARAQADAELAAQEAECQTRFAVTPCLLDAQARHRAIVDPLRRDQLTLDERERQQRATDRRQRLSRKAEAARQAASAAVAASASDASDASGRITKPLLPIRPRLRSAAASDPEAVDEAASAAVTQSPPAKVQRAQSAKRLTPAPDPNAAQRAEERVRQAEEHRARVLARNAERNAKKPRAAPLPVPGVPPSAATSSPVR